mmetsp:Transcript_1150/g.2073  ORF Transcript_1150/g.2073 Transcript_1150/m.2073 type:complete len:277 (+) Transcript_1150:848-1678(+)
MLHRLALLLQRLHEVVNLLTLLRIRGRCFPIGSFLCRRLERLLSLPLILLRLSRLLLLLVLKLLRSSRLLAQEVFTALYLQVNLAWSLSRREWRVLLLLSNHLRLLPLDVLLLELREKPIPRLVLQSLVLRQLSLDHQLLNMEDGVNILNAVLHNSPHNLQAFIRTHRRDRVSLNENVAVCQQLQGLQSGSIRSYEPLAPLDELVGISDKAAYFDDVTVDIVVQNLQCLRCRDTSRQQLYQVPCFDNNVGVVSLPSSKHRHGALNKIELASDPVLL